MRARYVHFYEIGLNIDENLVNFDEIFELFMV